MPELKSFVPMTGRGAFDCTYILGSGFMSITVKVFADFENRPAEGVSWTPKDKVLFQLGAQEAVQRNWNGKHRFINRHRNPMETVAPVFAVNFVANKRDATVLMRVPKYASAYGPGGLARCDSYVGLQQIDSGNIRAQSAAMVHSESTQPINVKLTEAGNISRDERRRIEDLVAALGLGAIALGGGGTLAPQLKVDLANFATQVKSGPPSKPLIPIVIDARYNVAHGAVVVQVAKQARAIRDQLRQFNLPNPVELRLLNDMRLGHAGVIAINPDLSFETTFDQDMWMDIFAHEYGHMLGLPDEYDNMPAPGSAVSKDIAIMRFLSMADLFGVPRPSMGRMTTSIMCKGRDVLRCHMVTALQALQTLSNDSNWKIA